MNNLNKYDETLFIPMQAIAGTRRIRSISQKSMVNSSGGTYHLFHAHSLKLALHLCDFCGEAYRRPDAKSRHQPKCPKRKDEAQQDDHTGANSTVVRECGETGSSTNATSTSGTVAKGACRNTTKADSPVAPRAETPKRAARKRERSISGPRDVPVKSRKTSADAPRRRDESQGRPVAPPEAPTIARAISPLPTRMPLPRPFPRFFLANTEELHDEIDRQKTRIRELEQALRDVQNGVIGKPADTPTRPAEARHRDSIDTQRRASVAPAAMRGDPLTLRRASFSRLGSSTPTREGSVETLVPRESSVPPRHAFMRERSTFSNASTRLSRRDSLATPPPYTPVEGMSRRASFASLAATDEGSDAGDRVFQEAVANAVATYGEDYLDDFYRRHNDHTDDEGTVHGEGTPFKLPGGSGDFELVEERAYNSAPYDGDDDAEDTEDEDYDYDYDEDHDDCDEEDKEEVDELDSDHGEEDLAEEKTDGPESKDDF
ncbi:uncharacterized protein SCHCODRAFT_02686273 [Schizophyllum commune H4-8]|uniref:uncharacterized protein n=1 Tax=Schizophyllum commune (strain H4-8 / FGSC 9210) TaxID=578458 RepID=UPI00215EBE48|nr:uncharacterized protein SCHCODRAFT_02686273 [Schizophyllum commune H4-8]KAI5894722.1 hypothetical protein SCHCODRAFT_02686273 [Schizophyllum commune H4-8]